MENNNNWDNGVYKDLFKTSEVSQCIINIEKSTVIMNEKFCSLLATSDTQITVPEMVDMVYKQFGTLFTNFFNQYLAKQKDNPNNNTCNIYIEKVDSNNKGAKKYEIILQRFVSTISDYFLLIAKECEEKDLFQQDISMLQRVLDSVQSAIFMKDSNENVVFTNKYFDDFFGKDNNITLGHKAYEFLLQDEAELIHYYDSIVLNEGETCEYEEILTRRDGIKRQFVTRKVPIIDEYGRINGLVGICTDIHDYKLSLKSVTKLTRAIEQSVAAVVITDSNQNIEYVNNSFEKITKFCRKDVMGMQISLLADNIAAFNDGDNFHLNRDEKHTWSDEIIIKKKDGDALWSKTSVSTIINNTGEIESYVYVIQDISDRVAIERELKHSRDLLKQNNDLLEQKVIERTQQMEELQDVVMVSMGALAESRDPETGNHIRRMQHYVKALAIELGRRPEFEDVLSPEQITLLYKASSLHDIGKVSIPDRILLKPSKLSEEEFEIMKLHPQYGINAIKAAETNCNCSNIFLQVAKEIIYSHHEKWDGSGYPMGLKEVNIPLSARILAVADVYDALISERIYKKAFSHNEAIKIVIQGRGSHFDPSIVDAFANIADSFYEISRVYKDYAYQQI